MSIRNQRQLENTRQKLRELEATCATIKGRPSDDARVRELTLRSLNNLVKQLKEEIARYEVREAG